MLTKTVGLDKSCTAPSISKLSIVKYIALLAMVKIVPTHAYLVSQYQDTIMASVSDQDMSIRMRALDLVSAMVFRPLPKFGLFIDLLQR